MAIDPFIPRSRRSLLASLLGAMGAAATATLAAAAPAMADGEAVRVGGTFTDATTTTTLTNGTNDNDVLAVTSKGNGYGVVGTTRTGVGVAGLSEGGTTGVMGTSGDGGIGVLGSTDGPAGTGIGVVGNGGVGIHGNGTRRGVRGISTGLDFDGIGVLGRDADGGYGVVGSTRGARGHARSGVLGVNHGVGSGVIGYCGTGEAPSIPQAAGVYGVSTSGRGGVFRGTTAQLRLVPSSEETHRARGATGDLVLDKMGRLWFCKGGTYWKRLA